MGWPAAIAAGASVASAAGSLWNSISNNSFQKKYAKNQHQWAVEDLKKAGLNPVLAAGGGNHGTTLQQPDFSSLGHAGSQVSSAMQASTAARQADSNISLQDAQSLNYAADTMNKQESNALIRAQVATEAARRLSYASAAGLTNRQAAAQAYRNVELEQQAAFYGSDVGKGVSNAKQISGISNPVLIGAGITEGVKNAKDFIDTHSSDIHATANELNSAVNGIVDKVKSSIQGARSESNKTWSQRRDDRYREWQEKQRK